MTRKEALEYVNNMWMYEDTKNALETLIPEFGKTGSDKVIDYEEKYNEALERVRRLHDRMLVLSSTDALVASSELEFIFPELAEIDDERIIDGFRTLLDGIKRSQGLTLNKVPLDKCYSWLEKQKEQKPAWSEEDERVLKGIIGLVDHDQHYGVSNKEMIAWLKSLRPSWKPSE